MSDKEKFYLVINRFDFLGPLWDQEKHQLKKTEFEDRLGTMSSGEVHLAKFMAAVWFHRDHYGFDLFSSMNLSPNFKTVITDWVLDPYWP